MTDLWVFAGCTSGVLLGLLAVGGYWALATFFHFSWLPYPPTPQIIPTGEFEWLRSLAAAVEVCVGAAVVFAVVAGIRNAIWNFFFKRKWNRAAEQRAELQRAVAGLDVVEALSKRVLECPPWAT